MYHLLIYITIMLCNKRVKKYVIIFETEKENYIMKKRILSVIAILIISVTIAYSQTDGTDKQPGKVHWYSIGDVDKLMAENPKPLFIDAYTDWCGWCKKLDKDTFSDPLIAKYLNENFYPVKFDAESKEPVTFKGKVFVNDGKSGKAHQLAVALLQGRMGYPTVVFLNEKGELLAPVSGYKTPSQIEPILVFFGSGKYLTQKWEEFAAEFKGSF